MQGQYCRLLQCKEYRKGPHHIHSIKPICEMKNSTCVQCDTRLPWCSNMRTLYENLYIQQLSYSITRFAKMKNDCSCETKAGRRQNVIPSVTPPWKQLNFEHCTAHLITFENGNLPHLVYHRNYETNRYSNVH